MSNSRRARRRLRARILRRGYAVDERAVAEAMLRRPLMRLYLAPARGAQRRAAA